MSAQCVAFLVLEIVCYGGYHANMFDVWGVCIAVGDRKGALVGITYFPEVAVGILCEFLGCTAGVFCCFLYHGGFYVV